MEIPSANALMDMGKTGLKLGPVSSVITLARLAITLTNASLATRLTLGYFKIRNVFASKPFTMCLMSRFVKSVITLVSHVKINILAIPVIALPSEF